MKTPKEKAQELFEKYNNYLQQEMYCVVYVSNAKQCAIICVDEILDLDFFSLEGREYWEEVRKELELL